MEAGFQNSQNESTPLLSRHSPPPSPSPNLSPSLSLSPSPSSSSSSKFTGWLMAFYFLLHVATIATGYYLYSTIKTQLILSDYKYANLTHDFENLQTEFDLKLQRYESTENLNLKHLQNLEEDLETRVSSLEKIPSNDEVLNELHSTEQAMYDEIESEKTLVSMMVRGIQANVTSSINRSNRLVDSKLNEVDKKVKLSERRMSSLVEETSRNVSTSVQLAEDHIQIIENNLTSQMTEMSASVTSALSSVRFMVDAAKADINEEVTAVHESMDQYIIFSNNQFAAENDFVKYQLAGTFSLLACLICLWHITSHARHISNVEVQKRLMAILWMVPIYSITSWLSLVFPPAQPYLGVIRDCYEAYVVYTFIAFLKSALGEDEDGGIQNVIEVLAKQFKVSPATSSGPPAPSGPPTELSPVNAAESSQEEEQDMLPESFGNACDENSSLVDDPSSQSPMNRSLEEDLESGKPLPAPVNAIQKAPCPCCIPAQEKKSPTGIAAATLHQCEVMAMQFVVFKPLLATAPFFVELCGYDYDGHPPISNGNIDWFSARLYIMILGNLSVSIAFYGLLCFFHLTEKDLAWCKPWPKFLCVKGVVFMTFWQDILLQCMSGSGVVDARSAGQIQNLLICIEMFMASIAHFYIFPYEEWDSKKRKQASLEVRDTMAFYAFLSDFKRVIRGNPQQKQLDNDHEGSVNQSPSVEKIRQQPETPRDNHTAAATKSPSASLQTPIASPNFWQSPEPVTQSLPPQSLPPREGYQDFVVNHSQSQRLSLPQPAAQEVRTEVPEESPPRSHAPLVPHHSPPRRSPAVILHGSDSDSDSDSAVGREVGIQSV